MMASMIAIIHDIGAGRSRRSSETQKPGFTVLTISGVEGSRRAFRARTKNMLMTEMGGEIAEKKELKGNIRFVTL
jgi:hypothetical protein